MKHLAFIGLACALVLSSGCDELGDGSLSSCATALVGDFEGDLNVPVTAIINLDLDDNGVGLDTAELVTVPSVERLNGKSVVVADGTITEDSIVLRINGAVDLDTCVATGDWSTGTDDNLQTGTFRLAPR